MKIPKIKVLCGGVSPERDVSIESGRNVFGALKEDFDAELVRLDENALPKDLDPENCVVYPAMHGDYGEDGTLQAQLDAAGAAYAGSGSMSSRICMLKPASKALMAFDGIPVAPSFDFDAKNKPSAEHAAGLFKKGFILKPADKGSSVGLAAAADLESAKTALDSVTEGTWMIEEFFEGREFSIGVLYGEAAGVVEIIPNGGIYDFNRKYTPGTTSYVFPAKISKRAEREMKNAAQKAYRACGCRDFCRVDFRMRETPKFEFAALEINTLPGMTPTSLLPKSASCIGLDFKRLCGRLMEGAFERFKSLRK